MSQNPYAPPSADLGGAGTRSFEGATGDIDIGRCVSDAWAATWENFPLWLGVGIVAFVAMGMATVTIVGLVLAVPHLVWGSYAFFLRMHDGTAQFGDLFEGFSHYGAVLGSMLAALLVLAVVSTLANAIYYVGVSLESTPLMAGGYLLSLAFSLVVSPRLMLCTFYLVERDIGGVEAVRTAWESTSRVSWWVFPVITLLSFVIVIAGFFALIVGVLPAMTMTYLMWASAYRQLEGQPSSL